MIELRGAKVLLRTLEREHCRQLWERYVPAEPLPTEPLNPGLSVEGADKWFEEMQAKQGREHFYLGIFTPAGELLGDIQLSNIDWRFRTAHLGGSIACVEERGQGYGTDAAHTLLRYGFDHLDLHRVTAVVAEHNTAAQRALEKLGFREEGRERQAIYCAARRWDRLIYGLLRHEFASRMAGETDS
jgi:RimJ/RimL family protein N-acetyltransferase